MKKRGQILRDAHLYGGVALASLGVGWWVHPGAGLALGGISLVGIVYTLRHLLGGGR